MNIVKNICLCKFRNFGTKYRLPSKHSVHGIVDQFKYNLEYFLCKIAITYSKPIEFFNDYKYTELNKFLTELNHKKI